MKLIKVEDTDFSEVKVLQIGRFPDSRGYFTETFRKSDIEKLDFLKDKNFVQINESFSKKNVVRGMHFQHSPFQEKLIRVISGKMEDYFMDIRPNSPYFGKVASCTLESSFKDETFELLWIPKGFAHGLYALEDTTIEYLCNSEYSPKTECSISPTDEEIDWSLTKRPDFAKAIISERDQDGASLKQWKESPQSELFKI